MAERAGTDDVTGAFTDVCGAELVALAATGASEPGVAGLLGGTGVVSRDTEGVFC